MVAWLLPIHLSRKSIHVGGCWYLEQFDKVWVYTHNNPLTHSHLGRDWRLNLPYGCYRNLKKIECLLSPSLLIKYP